MSFFLSKKWEDYQIIDKFFEIRIPMDNSAAEVDILLKILTRYMSRVEIMQAFILKNVSAKHLVDGWIVIEKESDFQIPRTMLKNSVQIPVPGLGLKAYGRVDLPLLVRWCFFDFADNSEANTWHVTYRPSKPCSTS